MIMSRRSRPDHYTREAKNRGYPARSVFKLEEIQRRFRVIRSGMNVLDIGAAPGSWTLYALGRLGKNGRLSAVDLKPLDIRIPPGSQFRSFTGDIFTEDAAAFLAAGSPFDLILCDAAPSTTGNRLVDTRRSFDLVMGVVDLAEKCQTVGGNLVVKIFQGGDEGEVRERIRGLYGRVKTVKPRAVRSESFETYLVAVGFRGL